jgi:hypothetical protein
MKVFFNLGRATKIRSKDKKIRASRINTPHKKVQQRPGGVA